MILIDTTKYCLAIIVIFQLLFSSILPIKASAMVAQPDLFISEYIEGSSNNKALEIYNITGSDIDLAANNYNIKMYMNGITSAGIIINLTGIAYNRDVFVLAHGSANAAILAQADQTNTSGWYNGNDAVALYKGTTLIDVIGQIGFDPGSEWGSGLSSTANNTLRRKCAIVQGDTNGYDNFDPSTEWDGYATDTVENLGTPPNDCTKPYFSLGPKLTSFHVNNYITKTPHIETRIKDDASDVYLCRYGIRETGTLSYIWTEFLYGTADNEMYCYKDIFGLENNKTYDIAIQGQDTAGNWSGLYEFLAQTVDANAPETIATALKNDGSNYVFDSWSNQNVVVILKSTDSGGGVDEDAPKYCVDQNNTCDPTANFVGKEYDTPFFVTNEGVNYIRYYAWDSLGNKENIKTSVVKIDKTKPFLSLSGNNPLTIYQNNNYQDPGYNYYDNISPKEKLSVSVTGSINTSLIGTYYLTYTVKDEVGNNTSTTRVINVVAQPTSNIDYAIAGIASNILLNNDVTKTNNISDKNKNDNVTIVKSTKAAGTDVADIWLLLLMLTFTGIMIYWLILFTANEKY